MAPGMLSASYVLPVIGRWYDDGIANRIPEGVTAEALQSAEEGSEVLAMGTSSPRRALKPLGRWLTFPLGWRSEPSLALFVFPKKATPITEFSFEIPAGLRKVVYGPAE